MFKTAFAVALLCVLSIGAEARQPACVETGTVMIPNCNGNDFLAGVRSIKVTMKRVRHSVAKNGLNSDLVAQRPEQPNIAAIVAPLAAKVSEIQATCGSKVVSGLRHTYIAGTHRMSLHASGKAVDMSGNPSCIYAHLTGWQGGYSTDYRRMRHVHLSYDPDGHREWGLRFIHGRHRR
jgi:hypothetical protein